MKIIPQQIVERLKNIDRYKIDEGWNNLLIDLDDELKEIAPKYKLTMVKEVNGGLVIGLGDGSFPLESKIEIGNIIDSTILKASSMCSVCGAPGEKTQLTEGKISIRCLGHKNRLTYTSLI